MYVQLFWKHTFPFHQMLVIRIESLTMHAIHPYFCKNKNQNQKQNKSKRHE